MMETNYVIFQVLSGFKQEYFQLSSFHIMMKSFLTCLLSLAVIEVSVLFMPVSTLKVDSCE